VLVSSSQLYIEVHFKYTHKSNNLTILPN